MIIDAHQHFWTIARGDYGWLTPDLADIHRDFGPADLQPILKRHGIDKTIIVQAAPTVAETEFMLGIAAKTPFVAGVVGWVDFARNARPEIARLAADMLLVGLRPMIHDIEDPNWMLDRALAPAFEALVANDLVFDALVRPPHLPRLIALVSRYPELRVVVDHGAKPYIREKKLDPWRADMAALAARENVFCKMSGLATEAAADWKPADLKPYVDHLLATFGPQRLIWGSDWPVVIRGGGFDRWREATLDLLAGLNAGEREAILGGNAARVYLDRRGRK